MKLSCIIISLLVCCCLGCGIPQVHVKDAEDLTSLSPNEAIVLAKIRILYDGNDVTQKTNVTFCNSTEASLCSSRFSYYMATGVSKTGYMFARMPVGSNWLAFINFSFSSTFTFQGKDHLTFTLSKPGQVYYIGDITIDWISESTGRTVARHISPFPVATGGEATLTLQDALADAQKAFNEHFGSNLKVESSLARVDATK
jgi:hypothetical protein